MRVSIIGTGYVGLVTGVCLADVGHSVVCVDLDADKVARIERGDAPIYEPGLDELLARNVGSRLRATTDLAAAVHETELTIVAVGTPFDGREIDLGYVEAAARQIGDALAGEGLLPLRRGQEHRRARHHRLCRPSGARSGVGQAGRP